MTSNARGLLRAAVRGLAAEPGSDAELLSRYVAGKDEDAFAALVRRHGPMVQAVCRRRLGAAADADDAFQVTFMVLARDAAKIARRESVAGWLYRVASMAALKVAGQLGRRPDALLAEPEDRAGGPAADADSAELRAALDREVAALPDRLRAVVVLCGLEERTNAEAAAILGCPTGTVDSRLSAARARLRDRLARRGLAVGSLAALDAMLRPGGAVSAELLERATAAALAYGAGRALPDSLTSLADGVTPAMSTLNVKLLVVAGMSLALFGSAGLGLYHVDGQDRKPPAAAKKGEPPAKNAAAPAEKEAAEAFAPHAPKDEAAVRGVLALPAGTLPESLKLRELFGHLNEKFGLICRLDIAAFKRLGQGGGALGAVVDREKFLIANRPDLDPEIAPILALYDHEIQLPVSRGLNVADILTEAVAQLPGRCGYRIRDVQVLVGPAYSPPVVPGSGAAPSDPPMLQIDQKLLLEQIAGEPVSLAVEEKPFAEVARELRKLTGANIVIDSRCKEGARQPVSGNFNDTRLLTVLQVLGDMCELKPVAMNNVYYLTTPENAAKLQKEIQKDLFGPPPQVVPAGYVTDGLHLYEKPANLKPAEFSGLGGGSGFHGIVPGPAPSPKPVEKK